MATVGLLLVSNVFMTFAWYGHLKHKQSPLWLAILASWAIAFFEYCFQVPANRIGHGQFSGYQLKLLQEGITLLVFIVFVWFYLGERLRPNHLLAILFLFAAGACAFWPAKPGSQVKASAPAPRSGPPPPPQRSS